MKNIVIGIVVFVGVTYAIDAYLFRGQYYEAGFHVFQQLFRLVWR